MSLLLSAYSTTMNMSKNSISSSSGSSSSSVGIGASKVARHPFLLNQKQQGTTRMIWYRAFPYGCQQQPQPVLTMSVDDSKQRHQQQYKYHHPQYYNNNNYYYHPCMQRRYMMARNRSKKRRLPFIFLEDHELSPRRTTTVVTPSTTNHDNNNTNSSSIMYDPNMKQPHQHRSKVRLQSREQEIYETEQIMERLQAAATTSNSKSSSFQLVHYCIKQHLWYRATPMMDDDDAEEEDNNDDERDARRRENDKEPQQQKQQQYYKVDIGLAQRSLESIGDVLCLTLFNNSRKENGPRLPDLNARRDHLDPYKKTMKTSLPFKEGELLLAIIWEGVEEDKKDHEFYLVTGRNIWRSPIRGVATLNMEYIDRNWTTHPPTVDTILLSIVCTRDDYYYKISEMYDGPLIVPDVENSTSGPNRQKKRIDKSRTVDMDNEALEEHCHPWVSPNDYHSYVEANPP